jgi:hypothetical protein
MTITFSSLYLWKDLPIWNAQMRLPKLQGTPISKTLSFLPLIFLTIIQNLTLKKIKVFIFIKMRLLKLRKKATLFSTLWVHLNWVVNHQNLNMIWTMESWLNCIIRKFNKDYLESSPFWLKFISSVAELVKSISNHSLVCLE